LLVLRPISASPRLTSSRLDTRKRYIQGDEGALDVSRAHDIFAHIIEAMEHLLGGISFGAER
jgi:hypothetical protein